MENNDIRTNKFYAYCECCNYEAIKPSYWIKHVNSQKHMRNGETKSTKCSICDYETSTHWLVKRHILTKHATKEERSKHKLYCDTCDLVFFSDIYYNNHMNGINHKNMVLALSLLPNKTNNMVNNKINDNI